MARLAAVTPFSLSTLPLTTMGDYGGEGTKLWRWHHHHAPPHPLYTYGHQQRRGAARRARTHEDTMPLANDWGWHTSPFQLATVQLSNKTQAIEEAAAVGAHKEDPSIHLHNEERYSLVTGGGWAMAKTSFTPRGLRAAEAREQSFAIVGARDGSLRCRNGGLPKHKGPDLQASDAAGDAQHCHRPTKRQVAVQPSAGGELGQAEGILRTRRLRAGKKGETKHLGGAGLPSCATHGGAEA